MIGGRAQAPMLMWGRSIPAVGQLLVDHHLLHGAGVPAPRLGPVRHDQSGVDHPAAPLGAFERGQLGHHRGQLRPDPVGVGGQVGS